MADQIRREPTHAVEFQLEDLFDPNDPVAIFVMSISFAWNDLMRDNVRLFETLNDDSTPPGEALYDAGNVSRHLWEITKLLATARDDVALSELFAQLDDEVRKKIDVLVEAVRDDPLKARLAIARDHLSHYELASSKAVINAIEKARAANVENERRAVLVVGAKQKDIEPRYADDVILQLLFHDVKGPVDEGPLRAHVETLGSLVADALAICAEVIQRFVLSHKDAVEIRKLAPGSD